MIPAELKVTANKTLFIRWDDGSETEIDLSQLRRFCPCALCAAKKEEHHHDYILVYTIEQLSIKEIAVIGNYAVGIKWGDNHNTGMYNYDLLYNLSTNKVGI